MYSVQPWGLHLPGKIWHTNGRTVETSRADTRFQPFMLAPVPQVEGQSSPKPLVTVAICLFDTIYDIFDTQKNERRLDDNEMNETIP